MAAKQVKVRLSDAQAVVTVPRKLVEDFTRVYRPRIQGRRNQGGSVTWMWDRSYGEAMG
jgi:hypothetical protein